MATVHLRPGHVQPVWTGHPWVFAQAIARVEGSPSAGDPVDVRDPRGNFLGRGYYSPESAIPVRIVTREEREELDDALLSQRVHNAVALRRDVLRLPAPDTDGYRLIHAEGDGLPGLVVDAYGSVLSAQFLTIGMKRRAETLVRALVQATGATSVLEVASPKHQKIEGIEVIEGPIYGPMVESLSFCERGFRWQIPPPGAPGGGGQKTGYYFDQRETRAAVEGLAEGRRVLDLYSYVGGFTLAAARGGAREVTAVDSSQFALDRAHTAAIDAGLTERTKFVRGDARKVMSELIGQGELYDLVVLDPPKLAMGARDLDDARGMYRKLNDLACKLVAPGGLLVSCSCSQAMAGGEFLRVIASGARDARREATVLRLLGQPPDHPVPAAFPEGRYLKCVLASIR
ncbi:MAG: class I SAM-dependent rRNA methyltransferase [Deltaproteobacteria bacterium]|nr:class I SAM-dependent rRNA methyltransferase [Deltaproteobacteria bacterium]